MGIATLVLGLVADLTKAGLDAYATWKADPEAAKAGMLAALDQARARIMTLDADLAANDRAQDEAAEKKFGGVDITVPPKIG